MYDIESEEWQEYLATDEYHESKILSPEEKCRLEIVKLRKEIAEKAKVKLYYKQKIMPKVEKYGKETERVFSKMDKEGKYLLRCFKNSYRKRFNEIRHSLKESQQNLLCKKAELKCLVRDRTIF